MRKTSQADRRLTLSIILSILGPSRMRGTSIRGSWRQPPARDEEKIMKRSVERTLATHVGSLPRSPVLLRLLDALEKGQPTEKADFQREVDPSLSAIVREQ